MIRNICRMLFSYCFLAVSGALFLAAANQSIAAPVFRYSLPQSWAGPPATVVEDLSPADNDGILAGTPALSATIPPGADPTTQSLDSHTGGIQTAATGLLNNAAIAAAGGFRYDVSFLWDGGAGSFPVQKIIDYAGTEFLQLENIDAGNGTAELRFGFNDEADLGPSAAVSANQWYTVAAVFDTQGNTVAGDGSLAGLATLTVNGNSFSEAVSKSNFGDSLNRRIGVGVFSVGGGIIELEGLVHDPAVSLIPEPATVWLLLIAVAALLWRKNRAVARSA